MGTSMYPHEPEYQIMNALQLLLCALLNFRMAITRIEKATLDMPEPERNAAIEVIKSKMMKVAEEYNDRVALWVIKKAFKGVKNG